MSQEEWEKRLSKLEFHMRLFAKMTTHTVYQLDRLVLTYGLEEEDYQCILKICENLSIELEEQKAEGFVHFHPLYAKFSQQLPVPLKAEEVVKACITQGLYLPLMLEFERSITLK